MNLKEFNPEEFNNLSLEEKKEFVRKLIHSEAAYAAFYNADTNESVSIKGLVDELGEEEALEIIIKAMETSVAETKTITREELKALIEKANRGECTENELDMLNFITNQILSENNVEFERCWMDSTLNLIHYAQKHINYSPKLDDVLAACIVLFTISGTKIKDGALSKYTVGDSKLITEICGQIADDIYDTWKVSCSSLPAPELIVVSLLQLAARIAHDNKLEFCKATEISELLNVSLDKIDDTENGSNTDFDSDICKPKTYHSMDEDREMRNLLKE